MAGELTGASQASYTVDLETQLHDGVAVTASGNGQVAAADRILDFGQDLTGAFNPAASNISYTKGSLVLDLRAIDTGNGDESYTVLYQLSRSASFASNIVNKAIVEYAAVPSGGATAALQNVLGRNAFEVDNELGGEVFRFARVTFVVAGTTPSFTPFIFLTRMM